MHGNTASRGSGHRIDVYRLLRQLGYHVISLDYRGYGDSDSVSPTEEGVVLDAIAVFQYIRNLTNNPIFIWGHSLGTGVATNMLSQLEHKPEINPRGVILEAPFTNIRDEIRQHPFARVSLHKLLPFCCLFGNNYHNQRLYIVFIIIVVYFSFLSICRGSTIQLPNRCMQIPCVSNQIST